MTTIKKQIIQPEIISNARRILRQQRREDHKAPIGISTSEDFSAAESETMLVQIDNNIVIVDRHVAMALCRTRQAKLVLDFDTPADYDASEATASEGTD